MTLDLELESWRQEWSRDTEPLPELKRRIHRQERRLMGGAIVMVAVLVFATFMALRHGGDGWAGFATGAWIASVVGGVYTAWLRRGTWKPAAQTTRAYADLLHRRAVAEVEKLVFLRRCLSVVLVAYGAFLVWDAHRVTARAGLVIAAMAIEWVWLRMLGQRRRQAAEAMDMLLDHVPGVVDPETSGRTE